MAIVEKKINSQYFDLVASGKKRFELRIADFDIQEGDTFLLKEWDPETKAYTGRELVKEAGYILRLTLDDIYALNSEEGIRKHGLQVITLN